MFQENVEWAGQFAEVWAGRYTEAVEALLQGHLAPDFECTRSTPDRPTGVSRGSANSRRHLGNLAGLPLRDGGDRQGRGTGSGVPIDQQIAVLCAFEGEKAIWAKSFLSKREALEVVGLRE